MSPNKSLFFKIKKKLKKKSSIALLYKSRLFAAAEANVPTPGANAPGARLSQGPLPNPRPPNKRTSSIQGGEHGTGQSAGQHIHGQEVDAGPWVATPLVLSYQSIFWNQYHTSSLMVPPLPIKNT